MNAEHEDPDEDAAETAAENVAEGVGVGVGGDGAGDGEGDHAVRPQTLMLNLLGRYLLDREAAVSTTSIIEVFARVGVGEHAARSTLARMVKRGMLTRQRHGRTVYFGLTAQAERILHDGEDRIRRQGAVNHEWDGYWTLLGFSLPESWQRQRHELRSQLAWAGFGPLFNGLWIAPGRVEVTDLVGSLGLESHVKAFHAQTVPGTDIAKMAQETWDLDAAAARYRAFLARWQNPDTVTATAATAATTAATATVAATTARSRDPLAAATTTVAAAATTATTAARTRDPLAAKLLLACDWLQVIRADPRLPAALLPADWPAAQAEALFKRLDEEVDQAAGQIAQQILDLRPVTGP